ncbi:hypothetical protein ACN38_g1601 [Penicillium nordicum]|uniref:Uncharacterized protein n=1 Tax=Penicillium nordicum TaxID=229535 RepID=A0A0M9WJQ3_9EURO|nr:hypothetical protein ACN38_g1601 [Penicillium nordicum]
MFVQQKAKPSGRTSISCHWLISLGEKQRSELSGNYPMCPKFLILILRSQFFLFSFLFSFSIFSLIHFFTFD